MDKYSNESIKIVCALVFEKLNKGDARAIFDNLLVVEVL